MDAVIAKKNRQIAHMARRGIDDPEATALPDRALTAWNEATRDCPACRRSGGLRSLCGACRASMPPLATNETSKRERLYRRVGKAG